MKEPEKKVVIVPTISDVHPKNEPHIKTESVQHKTESIKHEIIEPKFTEKQVQNRIENALHSYILAHPELNRDKLLVDINSLLKETGIDSQQLEKVMTSIHKLME